MLPDHFTLSVYRQSWKVADNNNEAFKARVATFTI